MKRMEDIGQGVKKRKNKPWRKGKDWIFNFFIFDEEEEEDQ